MSVNQPKPVSVEGIKEIVLNEMGHPRKEWERVVDALIAAVRAETLARFKALADENYSEQLPSGTPPAMRAYYNHKLLRAIEESEKK